MRFLWALLIAATGASTSQLAPENLAAQPRGVGHGGSPGVFRVSSAMPDLSISPAAMIPGTSPRTTVDEDCGSLSYEKVPTTSLGREIVRRGWHVTSETQVGVYVVVAYVRNLLAGTSAMCFPVEGHVAIGDRTRLIAIISNAGNVRARIDMGFWGIGAVSRVPGSLSLRITDGTGASPPIAEIRIGPDGIRVGQLAPADAICHGRASMPNVYDRTITSASRTLLRVGWRPSRGRLGLQSCSGTGVGYCLFNYRQGRRSVDIITVGEDRHVVGYEPHC